MKLFFFILLFSCATSQPGFQRWGIQLQNYQDLSKIRDAQVDLWVMDPHGLSSAQVHALKKNKKLISYLSIGEAEGYRTYFKGLSKSIIGPENPLWKNNFTVQYWSEEWQSILDTQINSIVDQGFDGVFLDTIDVFDRFPDVKVKAVQMSKLIIRLSKLAKKRNRDFIVILQNGTHIIEYLSDMAPLIEHSDGINLENVFSDASGKFQLNARVVNNARMFQKNGKFVLGLEYFTEREEINNFFAYARKNGIIPIVATRNLDGALIYP
jgi:cysteinyl-tRNA synthetase, unknown class